MESGSNCSRIFSQALSDTPCDCDAHSEREIKVSARSSPPRRKKKKLSSEAALCLGDLTLAAEGTNCGSHPLFQPSPLEQGALHDHVLYCIPEETAALKNLVRKLKNTVSHQSELLFNLQKTVEDQELRYRELQEKAEVKKCHVLTDLEAQVSPPEARNPNLGCQQYQLEPRGPCLQDACSATVLSPSEQVRWQFKDRVQHETFSLEGIKTNSKWLKFYTGFDGYPRLKAFLDFLQEGESLENGPPCALSPKNQLFLVLVRLRLGLLLQDLAFRFRISESTACRYWQSWIELMEWKLRQVPVAFSQRYIDAFKPQQQLQHHDMVLVALDCAELFFEAQGRTRGKRDGSRSPRAHYSIHGSALAAPSGFLTFNAGMGRELPTLPPFLQAGPVELTAQQEAAKRQVLSLHSLTDKVLGFRFLRLVHPQNMEDQVRRAWIISCYLACLLHEPMGLAESKDSSCILRTLS